MPTPFPSAASLILPFIFSLRLECFFLTLPLWHYICKCNRCKYVVEPKTHRRFREVRLIRKLNIKETKVNNHQTGEAVNMRSTRLCSSRDLACSSQHVHMGLVNRRQLYPARRQWVPPNQRDYGPNICSSPFAGQQRDRTPQGVSPSSQSIIGETVDFCFTMCRFHIYSMMLNDTENCSDCLSSILQVFLAGAP